MITSKLIRFGRRFPGDDGSVNRLPKIEAVFAINDPTAIGCDLAAKQAQRKDFFIVGVDGAPDVVPSLPWRTRS
jgi:hypothetical protein